MRIAEDVVGQALIATLQLSLGRHFTEPVTDPNRGAPRPRCFSVFHGIPNCILVERWLKVGEIYIFCIQKAC